MADFAENGRGNVFANKNKKNENHPDMRGSVFFSSAAIKAIKDMDCFANPEGAYADVAVWKKEGREGEYLSLSIGAANETEQRYQAERDSAWKSKNTSGQQSQAPASDEKIPF